MSRMTDEAIVEELRVLRPSASALSLALALRRLRDGELTHGAIVTFFKRAFPEVPLRVLLDVGAWHRVGHGQMSDEEFDLLLAPWLGSTAPPSDVSR